jgi:hypothetical protein
MLIDPVHSPALPSVPAAEPKTAFDARADDVRLCEGFDLLPLRPSWRESIPR